MSDYGCINITSYSSNNDKTIEEIFLYLEDFFSENLSGKIIFPICDSVTKLNNRVEFIKKRLKRKNHKYFAIGDKDLNVYVGFVNDSAEFKNTILEYDRIGIYIRYDIALSVNKWISLISYLCEKTNAYSIYYVSDDAKLDIRRLLYRKSWPFELNNLLEQYPEFSSLPNLKTFFSDEIDIKEMKKMQGIEWINYWNKDICEFNHFPDLSNDFDKSIEIIKAESGGHIWFLTEEPWTIENPLHRQKLIEAYQRFPNVGVRC